MVTHEKTKKNGSMVNQIQEDVVERSRDIWFAGLGAFATIEEEGTKFFNNLVEKGKEREEKGKKRLEGISKDIEDKRDDLRKEWNSRMEDTLKMLEEKFEGVLDRMGIPTRKEVQELINKVDKLSDRVSTLSKKMETTEHKTKEAPKTTK